jgi:hypothetical protein
VHILKTGGARFLCGLLVHILKTGGARFFCGFLEEIFKTSRNNRLCIPGLANIF